MRGATCSEPYCMGALEFLLTRLLRGATNATGIISTITRFLLTRLLRGATCSLHMVVNRADISTHTPLARRDSEIIFNQHKLRNFYSHASCEARRGTPSVPGSGMNFYSHASCEARRLFYIVSPCSAKFLLTRLLRGATYFTSCLPAPQISTHTPLARRD